MGHATVFTLVALTSSVILAQKTQTLRLAAWLTAGALVGLVLIVRNSTIVLLPWWLALGFRNTPEPWSEKAKAAVLAGVGAGVVFALQPLLLSLMTGHFTLNGYSTYGFSSGFEGIWKGLISSRHGLLAYHPLWVVMLIALLVALRRNDQRMYAAAAIICFCGAVLINGTWPFWWFGDSFGNRAYLDVLAPCACFAGTAVYFALKKFQDVKVSISALFISTCFIAANGILWLGYLLRRYPSDGLHSYSDAWLWWLK